MTAFSRCHPAVNAVYFALVLAFSMVLLHPACLALSLACALTMALLADAARTRRLLPVLLGVMVLSAALNPAFNHRGATILAYLPSGNPLTAESLAYGAAAAAMLGAVLLWCAALTRVMTSDKLLCLLGRAAPALSLVFSMALRLVPRFRDRLRLAARARKCAGDTGLRSGLKLISILTTWALESGVDTADSMTARGYGLRGRTAYDRFRFTARDGAALVWLLALGAALTAGCVLGGAAAVYFPTMDFALGAAGAGVLLCYGGVCLTPLLLQGEEAIRWRRSKRSI